MEKASVEGVERVLRGAAETENGVPGVVAMATDRDGNFYEGAAGERGLGGGVAMTTDTVFAIFSCTKAITGAAVMQLVEEGEIELSHPAKEYAPELSNVQGLEGFDADGEPRTRPPKTDVTVEQLMLHTAGFGYDFFNHDLIEYGQRRDVPSVVTATQSMFDPYSHSSPGSKSRALLSDAWVAVTTLGTSRLWPYSISSWLKKS